MKYVQESLRKFYRPDLTSQEIMRIKCLKKYHSNKNS